MKKIISLITIAFVLIIGFASCSGNLHDNNACPQVMGLNGWSTTLQLVDGEAEFTVEKDKEQYVAILPDGNWNFVIRGASVYAGSLPSGVKLENNIGMPYGPDAQNVKLVGLMEGVTYIMKVDIHDESVAYISIREKLLTGEDDDKTPTEDETTGTVLYLVGADPIGWSLNKNYKMTKADNVYTIEVNSLPSGWKIWDGTWDYSFGKGTDNPTVDGNEVDAWFAGSSGDFETSSDISVKITLTVVEGSDANGSSIPAKIKIESVN